MYAAPPISKPIHTGQTDNQFSTLKILPVNNVSVVLS